MNGQNAYDASQNAPTWCSKRQRALELIVTPRQSHASSEVWQGQNCSFDFGVTQLYLLRVGKEGAQLTKLSQRVRDCKLPTLLW